MRKISTLAVLAVALLFSGCKEEKTSPSLVHNVEFNGKTIPITGFYSREAGGNGYVIDSLTFEYDGKKHLVSLDDVREKFPFEDPNYFDLISRVATDYNFDGYMDIDIASNPAGQSDIFLYNPQTQSYYHHKELSMNYLVHADAETQTVKTGVSDGEYFLSNYKWINDQLTLIYSQEGYFDSESKEHIRITKTLKNGKWVETRETSEDGIDFSDGCPGNAKLLKSITYNKYDNIVTDKFKYDNKNRIIKIISYSSEGVLGELKILTYSGNKLVDVKAEYSSRETMKFAIDGNAIRQYSTAEGECAITTNSDGYISETIQKDGGGCSDDPYDCNDTYQYQDGNMIKSTQVCKILIPGCGAEESEEKNIEQITEFKYDSKKSPFYYSKTPGWIIQFLLSPIYVNKNNVIEEGEKGYKYEYDSDGFPTKQMSGSETATFTYCNSK